MDVIHSEIRLDTDGHGQTVDLTQKIDVWLQSIAATDGQLTVFIPGSTGVVTTIEYEPGALQDLNECLERIAPSDRAYHHDQRWGDGNGFSHLRAALVGPSLVIPVAQGRCILGTWQQVVMVECDLRPRQRRVVFSFIGELGAID
jgi:secondary thiamine-phosphate synthase enzyme